MKIKEILKEFGQLTTLHGIPNILRAKYLTLKIIWILFFLIATAAAFYMISSSIINYLNFEVVTRITLVNEQPFDFPTITICNRNLFNTLKDKKSFDENYEKIKNLDSITRQHYFFILAFNLSQIKNESFGLKLNELIIECTNNGIKCDTAKDFVQTYNFISGTCFRYNSGKNSTGHKVEFKRISDISTFNGLRLKIFTGPPEFSFPSDSTGLHIYIHNSTIEPSFLEGFDVPTGLETNIAVNRMFINKKEKPYSNCVSEIENYIPDFLKQALKDGFVYSQKNCLHLCYQSLLISKIGCYHPGFNKLNSTKPCVSHDDTVKSSNFYFQDYLKNYLDNYCKLICPLECNFIYYNNFISHGNFPTFFYLNMSGFNFTDMETFKKSYLSLNIYYDSFSNTKIEEVAKTELIDLIANIGGTLGLFLGVSVLSIAEIFELVFLLFEIAVIKTDVLPIIK